MKFAQIKFILISALLTTPYFLCSTAKEIINSSNESDSTKTTSNSIDTVSFEPIAQTMNNLRALMVDLSEDRACTHLNQRIIPLSSTGKSADDTLNPVTGALWIKQCSAKQIKGEKLKIDLVGKGWRWLARKKETYGAQFEVDEYFRFEIEISIIGTFDAAYDTRQNILTLWFIPTQQIEADFIVQNSINVKEETIWGDIVGTIGSIFGQSPGKRTEETISERGVRTIRSKLDNGFTVIMDLCTGNQFTHFGTFPSGKIPDKNNENENENIKMLSRRRAYLRKDGLIVDGPFTPNKLRAYYDILEGPGVQISLVCIEDAKRIMEAFIDNKDIPEINTLSQKHIKGRNSGSLELENAPQCEVVIVIQPLRKQENATILNYAVVNLIAENKPVIKCE